MAVDASGAPAVAWVRQTSAEPEIYLRRFTYALTDNSQDDIDPHIADQRAVWLAYDGNDYEVMYYNGESTIQVTDNESDDCDPLIVGRQIYWRGYDGNDYEIFTADDP
jgi:hypothetical protein